jgi:hypothetical protein
VTRRQIGAFAGAMLLLWAASDWPMHDISEEYLYSAHMLQHMVLAFFVPPLALLATPAWLMRAIVGRGRGYAVYSWLTKPIVAGVLFNTVVMVTHIPGVVNNSAQSSPLHYSVHLLVVTSALLMWTPVCGPLRELQLGAGGKMVYLFLQSVVPTVPQVAPPSTDRSIRYSVAADWFPQVIQTVVLVRGVTSRPSTAAGGGGRGGGGGGGGSGVVAHAVFENAEYVVIAPLLRTARILKQYSVRGCA